MFGGDEEDTEDGEAGFLQGLAEAGTLAGALLGWVFSHFILLGLS
jgi:hypothetical protein